MSNPGHRLSPPADSSPSIGTVRPLLSEDLTAATEVLDRDPIAHCFVAARIAHAGANPWRLGGELIGYFTENELQAFAYCGANLVPVGTTPAARAALADRLRGPRRCSSILGPAEEVLDLWRLLEPSWGPAREVRPRQLLMAIDHDPLIPVDPQVRLVQLAELETLLPACVAMFTEEVGISPTQGGQDGAYRARIAELIRSQRAFARIEHHQVQFKAEVGAATQTVCQVQGVWVPPALRGHGLAGPGMAAVVHLARRQIAPVVSLYVNDYNTPARKAYTAVGFRDIGTYATVLF
ncbi:MAG: GNAT family N-acetyltransferase [Actinomycetales bacterium]